MVAVKRFIFILGFFSFIFTGFLVSAQETPENDGIEATNAEDTTDVTEETEEDIPIPDVKLEPVFPVKNTKLIFVEGEEAISTNFNKEPILNYGCSGKRTLQLNRSKGLQGGASFYADFVFYVEEPGTYEFWYGGTPSGPADELYPSFVSPFKYVMDNSDVKRPAYREDIAVVENYTPSYYWNMVTQLDLESGKHQIRFEVDEKRGHDGKFYFYLDCFFFVKIEDYKRVPGDILPELFPKDMDNRTINYPFRSLDDYLIVIRDNPELVQPYVDISLIYSLLGDYLNAIKYLKRAAILDAKNLDNILLLAKNYIWKGDVTQGLAYYEQLLAENPAKKEVWMEAGKVAAWTGRYDSSVRFFKRGLDNFPGDLDLAVNLGITYLWMGKKQEAEIEFKKAYAAAGKDPQLIKALALVFEVNMYPDKAAEVYLSGMRQVQGDIEMYLLLEDLYFNNGLKDKSEKIKTRITRTFQPSENLDKYLNIFYERMVLREKVLADYRDMLSKDPDNLELREMLAQAYFWNGLKKESIDEYLNILSNHAYRKTKEMEQNAFPLLKLVDKFYIYLDYFSNIGVTLSAKQREISLQATRYVKAKKAYEAELAKAAKAKESGKELPAPEVDPLTVLNEEGDKLASLVADANELGLQYDNFFNAFTADINSIIIFVDEDNKNEEVFKKIIEPIKWKWDRNIFISEQQQIAGKGLILANHVLAKISQYTGKYTDALANYNKISEQLSNPEMEYGYYQSLLWSGNRNGALEYYAREESKIPAYAEYTSEIKQLADSYSEPITGTIGVLGESPEDESKAAMIKLADTGKSALARKKDAQEALKTLHALLNNSMVRTFYRYQEATYLLRNELGDSLLLAERLPEAIIQYKQVLAIDPWDITAIYRLGTVYQWNKEWYTAMDFFKRVYNADPNYENASALYNQLTREHADRISFNAGYLADSGSIGWEGDAKYTSELNGILGFEFTYHTENNSSYRWSPTSTFSDWVTNPSKNNSIVNHYTYQVHDFALGLPLNIDPANFHFTTTGGATLALTDEFLKQEATGFSSITGSVLPETFFAFNTAYPYIKADFLLGEHPYLLISGMGRYGTYPVTYGFAYTKCNAFSGYMNLVTDFTYTNVPFIKNFALRGYGEMDYIQDKDINDNITIYAFTGELSFNLFQLPSPYINLNLLGNFTYQDTTLDPEAPERPLYYVPHQVMVAGGGLILSGYLGFADGLALSLSLQGIGNYNSSYNVWSDALDERIKIGVSGNIEFIKGNGSITVGSLFSNQYNLGSSSWDSWNFGVNIGYTANMPALLAP